MAWIFALNAECGGVRPTPGISRATSRAGLRASSPPTAAGGAEWRPRGWASAASSPTRTRRPSPRPGSKLYWQLRTAPPVYRYALAGPKTDELRSYDQLMAQDLTLVPGLVVSEDIWFATGRRSDFSDFAPGYRWIPYHGERYAPAR